MKKHINGVDLWVEDQGEGLPLVLLHAFPLDHHVWKDVRGILAADYRVVLFDFRGFGRSDSSPPPYTMSLLAEDVSHLLDDLDLEKVVLGGISMGGYVALAFATYYPERLRGLALVDTRSVADTEEGRAGRNRMAELARRQGSQAVVDEMLPKFFAQETPSSRPDLVERVRALGAQASVDGLQGALAAMRDREDTTGLLHRLSVPSLVLAGEEDVITPVSDSQAMAAEIPGAVTRVIPRAGHLSPMEHPQAVAQALDELMQRVGRSG
jgi:pimeloyl-ACP methyl ester carboxylesterase